MSVKTLQKLQDWISTYPGWEAGSTRVCMLPKGLEELGWFVFSGCVALQRVVVPESVTCIGYAAFNNCTASLTVIAPSGSYASDYAKSYGIRTASE